MKKFNSILLIDDDTAVNEYHKIIIKLADVTNHIHSVTSGQEGLDYLTSKGTYNSKENSYPKPDLIFLDINMPAMNGFEFLEEYEKIADSQKSKYIIVMLTSSLNPDDKSKSEKIDSISDFLSKPLTKDLTKQLRDKYLF